MSSSLSGKIVLIVGGASGIGQAAAKLCAARGASVVVADNNETAGAQTASALNVLFLPVNVADENSVSAMCAAVKQRHGRLDALVQTAGVLHGAYLSLEEFSLEIWSSVLDVNLTGSFLCAKHTVPLLKRSERGVLVLVSSLAATSGSSSYAYGAGKGGVNSLGLLLAQKLAADRIRVNVVAPGNIDTAMKRAVMAADAERRGQAEQRLVAEAELGDPEGVGQVLAWLVSDEADYVRGTIFTR